MQCPNSITTFGILDLAFPVAGFGGILSSLKLFSTGSSTSENPVLELMLNRG